MMEKSNIENQVPEFIKIIAGYTDDELRKVLKKRKLYQKEAAEFAIQEAIRRGIIYSDQDLFAKEFKDEPDKFSIFPSIENEKTSTKFKTSISRSLLILGALPVVWGVIKIWGGQSAEGILIFIFGATWSVISFQLMRLAAPGLKLIYVMFAMAVLAAAYIIQNFATSYSLTRIDILITAIGLGFVLYAIGFLGSLRNFK
jgi:hypothetical protein